MKSKSAYHRAADLMIEIEGLLSSTRIPKGAVAEHMGSTKPLYSYNTRFPKVEYLENIIKTIKILKGIK